MKLVKQIEIINGALQDPQMSIFWDEREGKLGMASPKCRSIHYLELNMDNHTNYMEQCAQFINSLMYQNHKKFIVHWNGDRFRMKTGPFDERDLVSDQ
jgi:hypothetical protein